TLARESTDRVADSRLAASRSYERLRRRLAGVSNGCDDHSARARLAAGRVRAHGARLPRRPRSRSARPGVSRGQLPNRACVAKLPASLRRPAWLRAVRATRAIALLHRPDV